MTGHVVVGHVVVVGLGPGDPGALTASAAAAIERIPVRFVRTRRHPSASVVGESESFDAVYDAADSIDDVYETIVERLAAAAGEHGEICYAVPGSPLVAERTVELLRRRADLTVDLLPALSFVDLAWDRLGIDPFAAGVRLVDGHRFGVEAAGERGPLLVAQCDHPRVLSDIKLAVDADPGPVTVLGRLGLPDEVVATVAWADLDRALRPDHLTSIWIPALAAPVAGETARLAGLVRTLRTGCPWDREQTHRSLGRHLLEETYEVLDAIDALPAGAGRLDAAGLAGAGDPAVDDAWSHLEEELGDLLFQVVFHATLAAEAGRFELSDVARGIHDKLVARHPHVFAVSDVAVSDVAVSDVAVSDVAMSDLSLEWEQRKQAEKGRASIMDGIPSTLPSLLYADKVQRRAASLGLDWPDVGGVWAALDGELGELRSAVDAGAPSVADVSGGAATSGVPSVADVSGGAPDVSGDVSESAGEAVVAELGDVLFSAVNLGRKLGVDPEGALRGATSRFLARARAVEGLAVAEGVVAGRADPATVDRWWAEAKASLGD